MWSIWRRETRSAAQVLPDFWQRMTIFSSEVRLYRANKRKRLNGLHVFRDHIPPIALRRHATLILQINQMRKYRASCCAN